MNEPKKITVAPYIRKNGTKVSGYSRVIAKLKEIVNDAIEPLKPKTNEQIIKELRKARELDKIVEFLNKNGIFVFDIDYNLRKVLKKDGILKQDNKDGRYVWVRVKVGEYYTVTHSVPTYYRKDGTKVAGYSYEKREIVKQQDLDKYP